MSSKQTLKKADKAYAALKEILIENITMKADLKSKNQHIEILETILKLVVLRQPENRVVWTKRDVEAAQADPRTIGLGAGIVDLKK